MHVLVTNILQKSRSAWPKAGAEMVMLLHAFPLVVSSSSSSSHSYSSSSSHGSSSLLSDLLKTTQFSADQRIYHE